MEYPFRVQPLWYQIQAAGGIVAGAALLLGSLQAWDASALDYSTPEIALRYRELAHPPVVAARDSGWTEISICRGFEQFYQRAWNRLAELRRPLAVLMIDIDLEAIERPVWPIAWRRAVARHYTETR